MKDPAFLFYYKDWLVGTYFLNRREKGAYMDLLCFQADKGPMTINDIKEILNGDFECWAKLKEKFTEEEGTFFNKRLRIEKDKRDKFIEHQKDNASMRWQCHGSAKLMPLANTNENTNEIKEEELLRRKEKNLELRQTLFVSEVWQFKEEYPELMLKSFINYWTETNKSKTKMLWELKPTWVTSRRLATWANRDNSFSKRKAMEPIGSTKYLRDGDI